MSMAQSDMRGEINRRVNQIIANKLKAEQGIIGEDLAAFEQRLGVDYGGDQPATGKFRDELGIHREKEKVG
jgi:hypothetical protein